MVLTVSFVVSPETGLCCLRHPIRSVSFSRAWHQRRGVRTLRLRRPRDQPFVSQWPRVHRIPHQRSWRSRNAPLDGTGRTGICRWFGGRINRAVRGQLARRANRRLRLESGAQSQDADQDPRPWSSVSRGGALEIALLDGRTNPAVRRGAG